MNNSQQLANLIQLRTKEVGKTLLKISEECGISKNFMQSMKKEGYMPRLENLCKLADSLDCSVDYLLGRTDIPEPDKVQLSDSGQNEIKKAPANAEGDKNKLKKATVEQWVNTISQLSLDNQIRLMTYLELLVAEQVLDGQADK